ncbi:MAG TPA: hypothetical protein VEH06_11180, partial [Candidatus Bathyarchaeia archaeon]|nr:hypothetical protein [Candidatus Bathyarchaeia archaeon]
AKVSAGIRPTTLVALIICSLSDRITNYYSIPMNYRIIYVNICTNSLFAIGNIGRYVDHIFMSS